MTILNDQINAGLTGIEQPVALFQIVGPRLWSKNNVAAGKTAGVHPAWRSALWYVSDILSFIVILISSLTSFSLHS